MSQRFFLGLPVVTHGTLLREESELGGNVIFCFLFFLGLLLQPIIICGAFKTASGLSKLFLCVVFHCQM